MQEQFQLCRIFLTHIIQNIVKYSADTMRRTVYFRNVRVFQSGFDDAVCTCVDDRSRAAGLTDDACTFQLFCHRNDLLKISFWGFRMIKIKKAESGATIPVTGASAFLILLSRTPNTRNVLVCAATQVFHKKHLRCAAAHRRCGGHKGTRTHDLSRVRRAL